MVKNPPANAGDMTSIPDPGRSPGGENGNLFQCYFLKNPRDRGGWWAAVMSAKSWAWLSVWVYTEVCTIIWNFWASAFSGKEVARCCVDDSESITYIKRLVWYLASLVAQSVKNLPAIQETWVQFLGQEDPLEKEMATHSSILTWRIPWTEELGRIYLWGCKSQTWLSNWALFIIGSDPWVRRIPWRRGWLPTPVFLSGEFHGQKSLMGFSWGHKESDMTEWLTQLDPITYKLTTWRSEVTLLSRVQLFVTPWTIYCQAPPSIGFSRQDYWSGLPFPLCNSLTISLPLKKQKTKNWTGWSVVSCPVLKSIHFS